MIKSERGGKVIIEEVEEGEKDDYINEVFERNKCKKVLLKSGRRRVRNKESEGDVKKGCYNKMMVLKDNDGKIEMNEVCFGKGSLKSEDTVLIDRGDCIIIWIGKNAGGEKKFGIVFARKYQSDEKRNRHLPILQIREGKMQKEIDACFE